MEEQKLLTEFKKDSGKGLPGRKVIAQACKDAVSTTEIQLELELARDMQDNKKKAPATRRASVTALLVRWCKQRLRTNNIYSFLLTSEAHHLIIEDNQITRACFVLGECSQLLILHMLGNGFWRIFPSNWGWVAQPLFPPGTTIQQRGEPGDKRFLKGPDCLFSLSLLLRSVFRPFRSLCLFSRAWQSELLFLIAEEDWVRVQLYKPDIHVTWTRWGAPKLQGEAANVMVRLLAVTFERLQQLWDAPDAWKKGTHLQEWQEGGNTGWSAQPQHFRNILWKSFPNMSR